MGSAIVPSSCQGWGFTARETSPSSRPPRQAASRRPSCGREAGFNHRLARVPLGWVSFVAPWLHSLPGKLPGGFLHPGEPGNGFSALRGSCLQRQR